MTRVRLFRWGGYPGSAHINTRKGRQEKQTQRKTERRRSKDGSRRQSNTSGPGARECRELWNLEERSHGFPKAFGTA